jgi:hypothetical protein
MVILAKLWFGEEGSEVVCEQQLGLLPAKDLASLEVEINTEDQVEPIFYGSLSLSIQMSDAHQPKLVDITRSGTRKYAQSRDIVSLVRNDLIGGLAMQGPLKIGLPRSDGRTHRHFPIDSARFDVDFSIEAVGRDVHRVRLTNRVPGFLLDCRDVQVTRRSVDTINLSFGVDRSHLVQFAAFTLLVAALVLIEAIVFVGEKRTFAPALGSFFLSLWSIRSVFLVQTTVFPTLLDLAVLCLCVSVPFSLGLRIWILDRSPEAKCEEQQRLTSGGLSPDTGTLTGATTTSTASIPKATEGISGPVAQGATAVRACPSCGQHVALGATTCKYCWSKISGTRT